MQHYVGALKDLPYCDTGEDGGLGDGHDPLLSSSYRNTFFPSLNMNGLFFPIGKNNQKLVYVASMNIHRNILPT